MRGTYYGLTFETAVRRREKPLVILRVAAGDGQPPRRAVQVLRDGGLLVIPLDAGYVVGCAGADARAVARLCDMLGVKREQLMRLSEPSDQAGAKVGKSTPVFHPVTVGLMQAAGLSIVASPVPPGADPAPTAQHIVFQLGDAVDIVLDAGPAAPTPRR